MLMSVIVPSCNSAKTIGQCLSSLMRQTRLADEAIVVDTSSDETPQIIRERFPQVRLIAFGQKVPPRDRCRLWRGAPGRAACSLRLRPGRVRLRLGMHVNKCLHNVRRRGLDRNRGAR